MLALIALENSAAIDLGACGRFEVYSLSPSHQEFIDMVLHYIMAGRAFVVAKEVFIIETVVFWHWDDGWMTENNSFGVNSAMSIIICTRWLILIT